MLTWSLGVFHTLSDDDIINVASPLGVNNFGFFQNAGTTLRQGIEAKVELRHDRWNAYANYTFVDATYQSAITLSSPNNPNALTDPNNGDVQFVNVSPATISRAFRHTASRSAPIYRHRALEGRRRPQRRRQPVSGPRRHQPESRRCRPIGCVNLHTSYQVDDEHRSVRPDQQPVQPALLRAGHLLPDRRLPKRNSSVNNLLASLTDPRTFLPGMPLAAYAGLKAKF